VQPPRRVIGALAHALAALPALAAAWLCLRIVEGLHAGAAGLPQSTLFGAAIGNDALALLRYAFILLLAALPLAVTTSRRARTLLLGFGWSALLCAQAALLHYQWTAGVPLGADLFAYSPGEIGATVAASAAPGTPWRAHCCWRWPCCGRCCCSSSAATGRAPAAAACWRH